MLHGQAGMLIPWQQSRLPANAQSANGPHVEFRLLGGVGQGGPEFNKAAQGEAIRVFYRSHLPT